MKNKILETQLLNHQIGLFYLGQEGFIIKYNNHYLLLDAYLSDYLDRNCCSKDITWTRRYEAPISAKDIDFVDYVFCSHAHFDHADPDTLRTLASINKKAKYIVPKPVADVIQSYGVKEEDIIPAYDGKDIYLSDIIVTPIPSAHEQLNRDENGNFCEMGFRIAFGDRVLYHAGDCCIYDGLIERLGKLDIALLPVNGRDYFRLSHDIIGNMDATEAIELARRTGTELLIPMHFDLYDCNCISATSFVDAHERSGSYQQYHIFQPGEKYIFS